MSEELLAKVTEMEAEKDEKARLAGVWRALNREYEDVKKARDERVTIECRLLREKIESEYREQMVEKWRQVCEAQKVANEAATAFAAKWGDGKFKAGDRRFMPEFVGGGFWYNRTQYYRKVPVEFAVYTHELRVHLDGRNRMYGLKPGDIIWRKVKKDGTPGKMWGVPQRGPYLTEDEWNEMYVEARNGEWTKRPAEGTTNA